MAGEAGTMAEKRSLVRGKENGVEVWGCNACEWALPRLHMIADGLKIREDLHAAFHRHRCEDHPGPRRLAAATTTKAPGRWTRKQPRKIGSTVAADRGTQLQG